MNRIILLVLISLYSYADTIKIEKSVLKPIGTVIKTNAQIIQLSNQKQKIVSRLDGHVENYFVKSGDRIKKGDKVALIKSITLSQMTADFVALTAQEKSAKTQLHTTQKLYKKGLASKDELNQKEIETQEILAKKKALASQLRSLGIDPSTIQKATDSYILKAHADGVVGEIYTPLHTGVSPQTPLISVVSQSGYYVVAYIGVDDAMKMTAKTKGFIEIGKRSYPATFMHLMPVIDKETQRAKVLFSLKQTPKYLPIGMLTPMQIEIPPYQKVVTVKKSALTLYMGEWVVFVPKKEHEYKESEHKMHDEKDKEKEHEHEYHEDHEEVPYAPKVVEIISDFGDEVAIKGLDEGESYIAEGSYFIKSMLLKSALGEHGH